MPGIGSADTVGPRMRTCRLRLRVGSQGRQAGEADEQENANQRSWNASANATEVTGSSPRILNDAIAASVVHAAHGPFPVTPVVNAAPEVGSSAT